MRKALIVGINYYEHGPSLYSCVNDANGVKKVLERHGYGDLPLLHIRKKRQVTLFR